MTEEDDQKIKKDSNGKLVVLSNKELWRVLTRVFKFSAPEFFNLSIGTISLFLNSLTNLYFPYAIGKVVDSASRTCGLSVAEVQGPSFFFVTGALASFLRVYNLGLARESNASRLKAAVLASCLEQDLDFFDEVGTGEVLTTLEKDVAVASDIFADKIPSALRSFNSAMLGSVFLYRVSPFLCGVSLSTIPLVGIIVVGMSKSSSKLMSSLRELEKEQSVFVGERFRNISTVFLNGTQYEEHEVFNKYSLSILSQSRMKYFINGIKMGFINIATNASIIAVLYTGSSMVSRGELTQGDLTAFLMRSGFVGLGFSSMASSFSDLRLSLSSAARVFNYIDAMKLVNSEVSETGVSEVRDVTPPSPQLASPSEPGPDPLAISSCYVDLSLSPQGGTSPVTQLRKGSPLATQPPLISFRNVVFSYCSRPEKLCLNKLSLDIMDNSLTVVAGASGAGKSSMLALMCALYKPVSGLLSIDKQSIAACSDDEIKDLRKRIAVVQQSAVLFSGTIAYNIGYGVPNATREQIEDVARLAFSHEFIMSMTNGYDTEVGEGGMHLSGGQRQRIALCRALLRNTDILILDEPSSSLDCENEDTLINLLTRLKETKCVVVMTHSPSVMAAADALHLLEDGNVVESGTFSTLKNLEKFKFVLQSANKSMVA
mmetsp:Transcript_29372/g.49579  ORF Transcript_29372/g.49579 Transcript_29372/m.49579 type:complete len:657 (+) Transcript_29372:162-2132(+)